MKLALLYATTCATTLSLAACVGASNDSDGEADSSSEDAVLSSCSEAAIRAATPPSRKTVIDRALAWVDAGVMYSQVSYYQGYRQDCSGFVSMAWQLPVSRVSMEFAPYVNDISHVIDESQLALGDALNEMGSTPTHGHIMLFGGWLDAAHEHACIIQENHHGTPANLTAYDRAWFGQFYPVRYNALGPGTDAPGEIGGRFRAIAATPSGQGYWEVARDGAIFSYGDAQYHGGANGIPHAPVIGLAATPTGKGYWILANDGAIYSFGDAKYHGGANEYPHAPVVGIATARGKDGYWILANDGAIYGFGAAKYHGGANQHSHAPIIAIASTSTGNGYWIAARDGAVYSFGDARYHGGANTFPHQPVLAIAATAGSGYWEMADDGAIYGFGDAKYHGGANTFPHATIRAIAVGGDGYWEMADDGAIYGFGAAKYHGGANTLDKK